MSLGTKLQAAAQKVNTKLGTQDASITFRTVAITPASEFGQAYSASTPTDVEIASGIDVGRVNTYEAMASGGKLKLGDLKLKVPGNLLTENQLKSAKILYSSKTYSILNYAPMKIYSGVVVEWKIWARVEE